MAAIFLQSGSSMFGTTHWTRHFTICKTDEVRHNLRFEFINNYPMAEMAPTSRQEASRCVGELCTVQLMMWTY